MIKIEYDDGKPIKHNNERSPYCTPKGRTRGYYIQIDGLEHVLPIGFMRVSEMAKVEKLLNHAVELGLAGAIAPLAEES